MMVIIQEKVRGPRRRTEALTMGVSPPFKALQSSDYNNNTVGTNLLLWTRAHSPPFSYFLSRFASLPRQWQAWRVSFSGYVGSCLKGWMLNLWHSTVSPLQLSVSGEWAVPLFSLSLDSGPSRTAVCSLTVDPFTHRYFRVDYITPGGRFVSGRTVVCEFNSTGGAEGHYVCKDWPERRTEEGRHQQRCHRCHKYIAIGSERGGGRDGWWEGFAVRLRRSVSGDKEMDVLLCFRLLSDGGLQTRSYYFMV